MTQYNEKIHHEKAIKYAKELLKNGTDIEDIIQMTNLNQKDILQIKEKSYK